MEMNSWWILIISLGMLAVQNLLVDAGPVDMRMFPREQEEYERSWLEEKRGNSQSDFPSSVIV